MFKFENFGIELDIVILALLVLSFVFIVLCIVLLVKQNGLKKRYFAFMQGEDGKSLENAFQKKFENMDIINSELKEVFRRLDGIDKSLLGTYQKMSIVKYDAFKEVGGTLSFVLALLTKENDGILINSMHSNHEGCFIYIKEVKSGEVFVTLSDEESQALEEAKK